MSSNAVIIIINSKGSLILPLFSLLNGLVFNGMSHQNDKIADENVIFEIIASISCAIIVLAVIIVTIHYVKDSSLHSKVNYMRIPTTIKSTNHHREGKSNANLSKKSSGLFDRKTSPSKYVNKKCQCDADPILSKVQNDNDVNTRAIQNENGLSPGNTSSQSISRSLLFQYGSRLNLDQPNDYSLGGEPAHIAPSLLHLSYPGFVPIQSYQYIPYSPISWGIVNQLPLTSTKPLIQHNQIENTSKTSAFPQIKKFQDKSSQCLQVGNQSMITSSSSSSSSSLFCNNPKTDSEFYNLEGQKKVRHGVRLNVTLTEHKRMMQELHSKALERIQRLNEENKKYYQLDTQ